MKRKYNQIPLLFVLLCITSIHVVVAQRTCPQIVTDALQSLGDNCATLDRNTACYGYPLVSAEFSEPIAPDFFTIPSDIASLNIVDLIQLEPMNTIDETWGIAVMNLQTTIPNAVPGQAVKFLLLGDTAVEGNIEIDEEFTPIESIVATVIAPTDIIHRPIEEGKIYDRVALGDSIRVDAQNSDATFYRVIGDDYIGWIANGTIEEDDNLNALPIIDGTERGFMQSFYLRSGIGSPQCDEAPQDSLIIQSPEKIVVELTVNGVQVRLGSTIRARILPDGETLEFLVLDGDFAIIGAGADGSDLEIPVNHRAFACIGEPINDARDGRMNDRPVGCDWSQPEPVDADALDELCPLENIPAGILNYALDLDCNDPIPVPVATATAAPIVSQPIIPTSTPTSAPIIENNITDNNLCYEGNAWGDGRCQTDYDWQAGYYYGQLEAGLINLEDIPAPFYTTPTPIPIVVRNDDDDDNDNANNTVTQISASVSCGPNPHLYNITVSSGPASDTSFQVAWTNSDAGTAGLSATIAIGGTASFFVVPPDFPEDAKVVTLPSLSERDLGDLNCP